MAEAKMLAEIMLQLSIYFESDTDDIAEWLYTTHIDLSTIKPIKLITEYGCLKAVHTYVMKVLQ